MSKKKKKRSGSLDWQSKPPQYTQSVSGESKKQNRRFSWLFVLIVSHQLF